MNSIFVAALAFALSQITLSLLLLVTRFRSWVLPEWLLALFLVSVAGYLLEPLTLGHWLEPVRAVLEGSVPGVFWLLCASLFDDRFRLRLWNLSLAGFTVLVPLLGRILVGFGIPAPDWLFYTIPQGLEFVLLAMALAAVVRNWRVDLVEERRRLRLWFCAITGVYIFALVAMREIIFPDSQWLVLWQYVPVGLVCLITNLLFLQYRPGLIREEGLFEEQQAGRQGPPRVDAKIDVPADVEHQLQMLMKERNIYREMGLTIGQLADRLELPEYRLRRIINAGLGYRNFNDYLNSFRIQEAGQRLADPSQSEEAVLNIALDSGFRSLSSFNKAFREAYGVTPTRFRQQKLALEE